MHKFIMEDWGGGGVHKLSPQNFYHCLFESTLNETNPPECQLSWLRQMIKGFNSFDSFHPLEQTDINRAYDGWKG